MNTKLQIFPSYLEPKSIAKVGIEDIVSIMKDTYYEGITSEGRNLRKKRDEYLKDSYEWRNFNTEYNNKKTKLKATVYATTFSDGYRSLNNGVNKWESTGVIFLDVDKKDPKGNIFNPAEHPLVVDAAYILNRSLGGQGYHLVLKVSGLTETNYNSTYVELATKLGIIQYVDSGANKTNQPTALPYAPDLVFNQNSTIFSSVEPKIQNVPTLYYNTPTKGIQYVGVGTFSAKYSDLIERVVFSEKEKVIGYAIRWEGISFIKCHKPYLPISDGRKRMLSDYARNYMYFNPTFNRDRLLRSLKTVNSISCSPAKSEGDLLTIVSDIFKQKEAGTLKPQIWYKKKKIIFDPEFKRTYEEKMIIVHMLLKEKWKNISSLKLYRVIEGWDLSTGKITNRSLRKVSKMGDATIRKYISEFQPYIDEINLKVVSLKKQNKH